MLYAVQPMKMKSILTAALFILFLSDNAMGQSCNCANEFSYIKDKIERNYAGFNDKVNKKTIATYNKHSQLALEQSKSITSPAHCVYLINDWLTFFKDGHLQVGRNRISKAKEKIGLQQRLQRIERLHLSNEELALLKKTKGIPGIYRDQDSLIRIAVIKSKSPFRDYCGVVISSKISQWAPGQVLLEFKIDKDKIEGILYDKYYIPLLLSSNITKDTLGTFVKEGSESSPHELVSTELVASKVLSKETLYLKISTFNQGNAKNIDSLIKANQKRLSTMTNLIIDLRNNGGGADFAYSPLIPYLYTNTIKNIGADVLSTADNIAGWAAVATTDGLPPDQKVFISEVIKKMEQHSGQLVSFSEDRNITLDSVARYPKKIIILMNKNCGSTTEEFLLLAKQSNKVILMGEYTAGVLDYSNMRGAEFSCMPYMLYWPTSRSRRIDQGMAIDNVGIKPDVVLTAKQDWIKEAQHLAEQ